MGRELYHSYWHCAQIIIFTECPEFFAAKSGKKHAEGEYFQYLQQYKHQQQLQH